MGVSTHRLKNRRYSMKDSVNEKKGFFLEINLSIALFYSKLASFRKPNDLY
jgi:hypothetical protein